MSFFFSLLVSTLSALGFGPSPSEAHGGIFTVAPSPGEAHGGIFTVAPSPGEAHGGIFTRVPAPSTRRAA